jgi:hypothetical protein
MAGRDPPGQQFRYGGNSSFTASRVSIPEIVVTLTAENYDGEHRQSHESAIVGRSQHNN